MCTLLLAAQATVELEHLASMHADIVQMSVSMDWS